MAKRVKTDANRKPNPRLHNSTVQRFNAPSVEICILAGGLSERMGRDKSRLRIGAKTMLGAIRTAARATGLPVRVIRHDTVPKCGPLGGVYTALKTTRAEALVFLACDMPLISAELLQLILRRIGAVPARSTVSLHRAAFVRSRGRTGFPFVLPRKSLELVWQQIKVGDLSVQSLATALQAIVLTLKHPWSGQLFNVNTPKDWANLQSKLVDADLTR